MSTAHNTPLPSKSLWPAGAWRGILMGFQAWLLPWLLLSLGAVAVWTPVAELPALAGTTWVDAMEVGNTIFAVTFGGEIKSSDFQFSLIPWGITLLVVLLLVFALRAAKPANQWALLWAIAAFLLPAWAAVAVAAINNPAVTIWKALLLLLLLAVGIYLREWGCHSDWRQPPWLQLLSRPAPWVSLAWRSLRGLALVSTFLAVPVVLWAASYGWPQMVSLWKALNPGVVGSVALFLGFLAYLPTILVWTLAWLVGPGFSVGEGTIFSQGAVRAGELGPIPFFAWLPTAPTGWWPLAIPVFLALGLGMWLGRRHTLRFPDTLLSVAVTMAVLLILGFLLLVASGGSLGGGRLVAVGPAAAVLYAGVLSWGVPCSAGILLSHPWVVQGIRRFAARISGKDVSELPTARLEL